MQGTNRFKVNRQDSENRPSSNTIRIIEMSSRASQEQHLFICSPLALVQSLLIPKMRTLERLNNLPLIMTIQLTTVFH
jgi:hypothetical protein